MEKVYTGAKPDPRDERDYKYDDIVMGSPRFDWEKGYDIEKELDIKIPFKSQGSSESCVGQAWSYYVAVLNTIEVKEYSDASAKAVYSQIFLPSGGAYIRDGGKLITEYGALPEQKVSSYINGNAPDEKFMRDRTWMTEELERIAKILSAKEYRVIEASDCMDLFALAIQNNGGVVGGVAGTNNGTWNSNEPKPPTGPNNLWYHCLYFSKAGIDKLGKFIATPNSWGFRGTDELHQDGWQKLREDYFKPHLMFNPWTMTDKPNEYPLPEHIKQMIKDNEKKVIIEGEAPGRKGIIVNGKLREIAKDREASACLYALVNNGLGITISKKDFDELPKDENF